MDSTNPRTPSGGDRRPSNTDSNRQSLADDGYDLSEYAVADGFRPTSAFSDTRPGQQTGPGEHHALTRFQPASFLAPQPTLQLPSESSSTPSSSSLSLPQTNTESLTTDATTASKLGPGVPPERPSSCSKPHREHDSLSLQNDGSSGVTHSQSGVSVVNASSESATGSSTPSQPFQMYMQRAAGSQASSGQRDDGHRGPTHPYSLYPQNTSEADESTQQHIPVGFPGMGGGYQRQMGVDGEEAGDLVGPLGHLEELPPYTRYPDQPYADGRRDSASATQQTADTQVVSPSPTQPPNHPYSPGAGGIGLATRNPEFSSTEDDLAQTRSRRSAHSGEASDQSRHDINTAAAAEISEKPVLGRWQRRARKKLWGIVPYWAICLLIVGLLIVGIVMGAVLGTLLPDDGKPDNKDVDDGDFSYGPVPTAVDVDPIPTLPPDTSPLATGFHALPPLDASQAPRSCFNDTTQSQAWSCEMPFRYFTIAISAIPNASEVEAYKIILDAVDGSESESRFLWGTQPPEVLEPAIMKLVNDTFEPSRGPAWWHKIVHNKTVIVSESRFNARRKRSDWEYTGPPQPFDPTQFQKGSVAANDGDTPWICTWPDTTVEIFIYPNQNASLTFPSGEITPTPTTSGYPMETDTRPAFTPTPAYPQVVKLLERRLDSDDESVASCRKVKISNGGQDFEDVLNDDGDPIVVIVREKQTTLEEQFIKQNRNRHSKRQSSGDDEILVRREVLELTDCGCLWWST